MNFDDASSRHGRITIDFDAEELSEESIDDLAGQIDIFIAGISQLGRWDRRYVVVSRIYDRWHRRSRILRKRDSDELSRYGDLFK